MPGSPLGWLVLLLVSAAACQRDPAPQGSAGPSFRTEQGASTGSPPALEPLGRPLEATNASRIVSNGAVQPLPNSDLAADRPAGASPEDVALAQKVRVALSTGSTGVSGIYSDDMLLKIGVTVSNGVVRLTGTVADDKARNLMANRARSIEGVRGVENHLGVTPAPGDAGPFPGAPAGWDKGRSVPPHQGSEPQVPAGQAGPEPR